MVGDKGLTESVLAEIERALKAHELIKVKAATDERELRGAWMAEICEKLGAHPVQSIGKVLVLWRENPDRKPAAAPVAAPKAKPKAKAKSAKPRAKSPPKADLKDRAREVAKEATRSGRPRSRTPSPLPAPAPRQRRPRTSR
jgi:putative YhbY family RNA-binding protein